MKHEQRWERGAVGGAAVVMVLGWGLAGGPGTLAAMFLGFSIMLVVAGFRGEVQAPSESGSASVSPAADGRDLRPVIVTHAPGELRPVPADHAVTREPRERQRKLCINEN